MPALERAGDGAAARGAEGFEVEGQVVVIAGISPIARETSAGIAGRLQAVGERLGRARHGGTLPPSPATDLPPVLLLGGELNALSVARDLGRMGVTVYAVGAHDSCVKHSKYVRWVDVNTAGGDEAGWSQFLLGESSDALRGAVLLACCDAGLRVLAGHRDALLKRFKLDAADPRAQIEMLDKLTTYEHAKAAGVLTPKFWAVDGGERLAEVRDEIVYPLIVKPRLSHVFEARFGTKHVVANRYDDVVRAVDAAREAKIDVLLVELIPGGDDCLSSYFTYVTPEGVPLFDYTKSVIRRYPAGVGAACYHLTEWVPELVQPARRLLRQSGLRGLANIEFKCDPRDGRYKLIECNGRFVASNCLLTSSGCNLAALVYSRIVGLPHRVPRKFKGGMRMWDPVRDFYAFRERRATGELTVLSWLVSVCHRQTFPVFCWSDWRPGWARAARMWRSARQARGSHPQSAVIPAGA